MKTFSDKINVTQKIFSFSNNVFKRFCLRVVKSRNHAVKNWEGDDDLSRLIIFQSSDELIPFQEKLIDWLNGVLRRF